MLTEEEKNRQDPEVAVWTDRPELTRKVLGVAYAQHNEFEKLDIYLPEQGDGPFPVLVDVHGGGWFYGSRSSQRMDPVLEGLEKGYAVVSVDYTLSRHEKFPLPVQELKAAIRFLRKNAAEYHLDGSRIGLWGLSAGAHLAMLAAFSADTQALDDPALSDASVSCAVQALVALYGPVDLTCSGEVHEGSMEALLLGCLPRSNPALAAAANPANYVSPAAPACFMQYGLADELVPPVHGEKIRDTLLGMRQGTDEFGFVPNAKHADKLFRTPQNTAKIYAFLDKHLR